MKRFLCLCLCTWGLLAQVGAGEALPLSAQSAILLDAQSGRVLWENNAHERRDIASITKVMTALVVLETCPDLQETIEIQAPWTGIEGSSLYLKAGETLTLETLLYGLLLHSGNDAALALACHTAGSVAGFVQNMNEYANKLGMQNTHFQNPNGLGETGHYSTAYDMAILTRFALQNETFRHIVSTKTITQEGRTFRNHNKLLWQHEGCIGVKTGFTKQAGRTLISAVERENMCLIAVTLHAPDDWQDHATLYDFGFAHYRPVTLLQAGTQWQSVPIQGTLQHGVPLYTPEGFTYPLKQGEQVEVQLSMMSLHAPCPKDAPVGYLTFILAGKTLANIPLCTAEARLGLCPTETIKLKQKGRNTWKNVFRKFYPRMAFAPDARQKTI